MITQTTEAQLALWMRRKGCKIGFFIASNVCREHHTCTEQLISVIFDIFKALFIHVTFTLIIRIAFITSI